MYHRGMRLLPLSALLLISMSVAQTSQYRPTEAQLLAGSKKLFEQLISAASRNSGVQIADLYHPSAAIVVERQSSNGEIRILKMTGEQYKQLLKSVPLNEAPDRYFDAKYELMKGSIVKISSQRQSVSRGYTAPNTFYVQPDVSGRFWIIGEQGIQKVK